MRKKMWKQMVAVSVAAGMMAMSLAGCQNTETPESAAVPEAGDTSAETGGFEEMTIKLGHGSSPADDDPYHILAMDFKENVEEATGGKVTVEIFPSGQLGGEMDSYEGLGMGTVDMCIATANIFGLYDERTTIMDMPFLLQDEESAQKLLDSDLIQGVLEELSDTTGAVHLGFGSGGFRHIFNNVRPIYKPEDLKDVKLRVPETTIFVDTFAALGANVTPMTYSETYTGIQQKTIDGIEVPIGNGYTVGYYEVCDYLSLTRHFYNALSLSISKSLYDGMSPELQQILKDAAVKAGQDQRISVAENEAGQLEAMKESGIQVNEIDDVEQFRALVQPIYDNYRDNISADIYSQAMEILGIEE